MVDDFRALSGNRGTSSMEETENCSLPDSGLHGGNAMKAPRQKPLVLVSIFEKACENENAKETSRLSLFPVAIAPPSANVNRLSQAALFRSGWGILGYPNTRYELEVKIPSLALLNNSRGLCQSPRGKNLATIAVLKVGKRVVSTALLSLNGKKDASFSWTVCLRWQIGTGYLSVQFFTAVDAPTGVPGEPRWAVRLPGGGKRERWTRNGAEIPRSGILIVVFDGQAHRNGDDDKTKYIIKKRKSHRVSF